MARKTWIKVKRGLITDPKHRLSLGTNVWLYLYMLDIADWDTGKIVDWHDKAAADELEMPLTTIRYQRRKLEPEYISCLQLPRHQVITIKNWTNPREYSGQVYNESDNELVQSAEGDNEGDNEGTNGLTPLHIDHISHNTLKDLTEPERIPVAYVNNEYVEVDEVKESKPKHGDNYRSLMSAIASVCKMDIGIRTQASQIGKAAKELDNAGYTPDQVYDFLGWWKKNDWRWAKNQRNPAPHELLVTISKSISVSTTTRDTSDDWQRLQKEINQRKDSDGTLQ